MKKLFSIFFLLSCFFCARADHITGGEMFYRFIGFSGGTYQYTVTMKLFMRCNSGRQFNDPSIISVFSKATNNRIKDISVSLSRSETIQLSNFSQCITNPPSVCYVVGYYEFQLSLPPSPDGYIITGQVVFRVAGIKNLVPNYGSIGATYTAEIPGTSAAIDGPHNSSASFVGSDLVVICADNSFNYSFAAADADGDQLRYSFCDAYQGGSGGGGNTSNPPASPPYQPVPYSTVYNSAMPLGSKVHIDPSTGLITGIAPADPGVYVVTVCVEEIRNGIVIAVQRKDIQINVAPCTIAAAKLQPEYMLCDSTKTITVSNLVLSPLINSQYWEFRNSAGDILFSSGLATPTYSFADTGLYTIRLTINKGAECSDSTKALVRVYPGFNPNFSFKGICVKKPTSFTDLSTTVYGTVNSWSWTFDDDVNGSAFSDKKNPVYTFGGLGAANAQLVVTNTLGCVDTVVRTVPVTDKPPVALAFRDTLICVNDRVQLGAGGNGIFSWSPAIDIVNATTATPTVTPPVTRTYYVLLDDDGCLNSDSVKIRVTDHVTLKAMNDTTICKGDSIRLHVVSDGFKYLWTPAAQVGDAGAQNPFVFSPSSNSYQVIASIGGCSATAQVAVKVVPYPQANAGRDTTICYNSVAQLSGSVDGSSFKWSPAAFLQNASSLSPLAKPPATMAFVLAAYDTKGCPKAGTDTILIKVLPAIHPFAGHDTTIIAGQPLQLLASGGIRYAWSPATGLSSPSIANPVASFSMPVNATRYKVVVYNEAQCADSAFVTVTVFKTGPSVFVPNAFTPNGDGTNDRLKPVAAGMKSIAYFNVYNRWGQLVYRSAGNAPGWDGTVSGKPQNSGEFVWMVKAVDYTGKPYFEKGTVILIR